MTAKAAREGCAKAKPAKHEPGLVAIQDWGNRDRARVAASLWYHATLL